jgi:hypothetical protein
VARNSEKRKVEDWRALTANLMMFSFILFTSVGAALLMPAAGLITAGVACGIFGYLLGSD